MSRILAFGIAREIMGGASIDLTLTGDMTADALKAVLSEKYPRLRQLTKFMIAVNGEYAEPGQTIKNSDEIAIIPPVSGG